MNISCSECRSQLGEVLNGEITGDISAIEEARAHIVECDACRRELALMRAARNEMRSFPDIAAAPDLRQSIRAQIAQGASTPVAQTAAPLAVATSKTDTPDPTKPLFRNYYDKPRHLRSNQDRLVKFLQRPSNIAWASGLALSVFCLVLSTRPERQLLILPSSERSSKSQEYYGEDFRDSGENAVSKSVPANPNRAKATAKSAPKTTAPTPTLPGAVSPPTLPSESGAPGILPGGAVIGSGNDGLQLPDDLPSAAPPRKNKPAAASGVKPNSDADSRATIADAANPAAAGNSTLAESPNVSSNGSSNGAERNYNSRALPTAPPAATRKLPREQSATSVMRAAPKDEYSSAANSPSGAGIMNDNASESINGAGNGNRNRDAGQQNRTMSKSAAPHSSTPVSRQVTARISAPRDVNWGQVSVVLPDGVRFSDGSRARVVWRGAIGAGEKIEVPISVETESGSHAIRVSLQEIVKGDAQTIARDSVSVNGR